MKAINVILIILTTSFSACSIHFNDYYSGIIIDEFGLPIEGVSIKENSIDVDLKRSITDKNGFFKMNRSENILPNLILTKKGFISDTIPLV